MTITNPAEQAVQAEIAKQIAAGEDPFGDEPIVAESIDTQAAAAAAEQPDPVDPDEGDEPEAKAKDEPTEEDLAAVAGEDEPQAAAAEIPDEPAPRQFRTASREAMEADREKLYAAKEEAYQKVMDGEMTPADYSKIDRRVTDSLLQLAVQSALAEQNAQTAAQAQDAAIFSLIREAKTAGTIDYTADLKAQKQFDTMLTGLQADTDNAGRSYRSLAGEAHNAVLALRGIAPTPVAAKPAEPVDKTPPAREATKPPLTLRGLPAAQTFNTGGTLNDALGRLRGQEFEAAFAKLSPAQKAALVDD